MARSVLEVHECVGLIRPAQLETCGQRGNPNLPHGSVRADHEPSRLRLLEEHFEFLALPLNVEAMLIAQFKQSLPERLESCVTFFPEVVFVHV